MRLLLLLLLAAWPASAKEFTTRIVTDPPCFSIYRISHERLKPDYLGESGQDFQVRVDDPNLMWRVFFVYHSPGTTAAAPPESLPAGQKINVEDLVRAGRYPEEGALRPVMTQGERLDYFVKSGQVWPWAGVAVLGLAAVFKLRSRVQTGPRRIGPYEVQELLGEGGYGEVYQVRKPGDTIEAALKLLRRDAAEDRKRFEREVKIIRGLQHPNIVRLYDWGEVDGQLYLVMELLRGETLGERLQREPRPAPELALQWLHQLGGALGALHEQGLVHRDVKPDNIFLTTSGTLKLMDFGIAFSDTLTKATATGLALGTPAYMAPEQIQSKAVPASDQYAVGVLAYMMLSGRKPFEADDPIGLAHMHIHEPVPSIRSVAPEVNGEVELVLRRMLAKRPEQRYGSVAEAVAALARALEQNPVAMDDATGEVQF